MCNSVAEIRMDKLSFSVEPSVTFMIISTAYKYNYVCACKHVKQSLYTCSYIWLQALMISDERDVKHNVYCGQL